MARLLGRTRDELEQLALASEPGAGGVVLVPYLDGERTPNLPDASGTLHGLRSGTHPSSSRAPPRTKASCAGCSTHSTR